MRALALAALAFFVPGPSAASADDGGQDPSQVNAIALNNDQRGALAKYAPASMQQLIQMLLHPPSVEAAEPEEAAGQVSYTAPPGYENPRQTAAQPGSRDRALEASVGPLLSAPASVRQAPAEVALRGVRPAAILPPAASPGSASPEAATARFSPSAPAPSGPALAGLPSRPMSSWPQARDPGPVPAAEPDAGELIAQVRRLNRQGRHDEAARAAKRLVALAPRMAEGYTELSWALLRRHAFEEARRAADAACRLEPRNAWALYLRAAAEDELGRSAEAFADIRAAERIDPATYAPLRQRAERGDGLFLPSEDENWQLIGRALERPPEPAAQNWGLLVGGIVLLLAAAFGIAREPSARRMRLSRWTTGLAGRPPAPRSRTSALPGRLSRGLRSAAQAVADALRAARAGAGRSAAGSLGGKYHRLQVLGRDGGTEVVQGLDTVLGRTVILRRLWSAGQKNRPAALARARGAAALAHPHLADVYEVLDLDQEIWLVCECAPGRPLPSLLQQGPLELPQALDITRQILTALAYAHESGGAHGGLEAARVIISPQGHAKLTRFGLEGSGRCDDASGEDSAACDVQAAGVCLYQMLTGKHPLAPYAGTRIDGRRFPRASSLRPNLPAQVDELVDRLLGEAGVPSARSALARLSLCAR
ncbi:MAG TPA: protein kinase [Elusimicrobiota bacterium]|jgi:tetratricopeptide (TPR) repeat protein|nr:protein kinase [Elusimicrobiota bacterium]